jgi:hypothetical protein
MNFLPQCFVMSESSNMLIAQRFFPRRWWGKRAAEGTGGGKGTHFASFGWCLWHVTKRHPHFLCSGQTGPWQLNIQRKIRERIESLERQVAEHSEEKEQLDQALQRNSELEAQIATLQRMAPLLQGRAL